MLCIINPPWLVCECMDLSTIFVIQWNLVIKRSDTIKPFFMYGHASWTRHPKRVVLLRFSRYLGQTERYLHECGLIWKVIKGSIRPVNMKSIAFQMTKICMKEWQTLRGGGGGGGRWYTQSLWEKHAPRDKTPLKWNNFANIGTIDLIFVSLYS